MVIAPVSLGEATLSPVRAASSISRFAVTNRRPSAGTRLPASISTISPGTSPSASISIAWPSRRTRAMFFIIFSSAARLASALASPCSPNSALKTVRPSSTTVVPHSCVNTWLIKAVATRRICMKSRYWRRNACQPDSFFLAARTLGPYCCRRCCASVALSPFAGSTFSCCATASGVIEYHFGCSCTVSAILYASLLVFLRNPAEWMVRLDVVALRLAFGEFHLLARDFLVGDQTQQVGDAVQSPAPLVV